MFCCLDCVIFTGGIVVQACFA